MALSISLKSLRGRPRARAAVVVPSGHPIAHSAVRAFAYAGLRQRTGLVTKPRTEVRNRISAVCQTEPSSGSSHSDLCEKRKRINLR